ncbi:MAG: hypothetical protein ACLU3I_03475 [Acutalibacteraceae bacterium]
MTSKTYTVTVSFTEAPKSNDANVSSVTVAGVEATAGENNTYTVTLPYGTDVTAGSFVIVTSDSGATVGALTNEGNVWTFTVTAEDGVTSKTYTVTVSFTEAPKSNDANVSSVTVAGFKAVAGCEQQLHRHGSYAHGRQDRQLRDRHEASARDCQRSDKHQKYLELHRHR